MGVFASKKHRTKNIMKVGILSMQRVNNYGSFWQARFLKELIETKGHSVEFIDIVPGKMVMNNLLRRKFELWKLKRIPYYAFSYRRKLKFDLARQAYLKVGREKNFSDEYDLIVIGSDEVFNFAQKSEWCFSRQLFGDINNENVVTYAASFGSSTMEDVVKGDVKEEILSCISKIKMMSVRDDNSYNILHEIGYKNVIQENLDPVLISDLPKTISVGLKPFILIYSYDFRFNDRDYIKEIRAYAKRNKLKIYSVGFYQTWCDRCIIPKPEEIFNYFNEAECIVTDTFHGSIFSMKLHKRFVTIIRESNTNKLLDLMKRTHMTERIISSSKQLVKCLDIDINYDVLDEMIEKEKIKTQIYINSALELKTK